MPLTFERLVPAHAEPRTITSDGRTFALDHCVDAIAFVDDDTVFCGSADHTCSLWNLATAERRFVFTAKVHDVRCVAVTPDRRYAVSGHGSWGGVCVWDLTTGALVHQLDESLMYVSAVGFFQPRAGGPEVIAHVGGGLVRWSLLTGAVVKADDHEGKKFPTAFSSTHVLRALPKRITWSSLPGEKKVAEFGDVPRAQCAAVSLSGRRAGVGGGNGLVRVVDVDSGAVLYSVETDAGFDASVTAIALGDDLIVYGTQGGQVIVVADGRVVESLRVDGMAIRSLALSHNGKRLAVGLYTVHVFAV